MQAIVIDILMHPAYIRGFQKYQGNAFYGKNLYFNLENLFPFSSKGKQKERSRNSYKVLPSTGSHSKFPGPEQAQPGRWSSVQVPV